MDLGRLKILEVFWAGGIYALRGYSETIGKMRIRTFQLRGEEHIYRVDLVDTTTNVILMRTDEADPVNAADRFEEFKLQIAVADSLFGWL
jgi:hypothetical protein